MGFKKIFEWWDGKFIYNNNSSRLKKMQFILTIINKQSTLYLFIVCYFPLFDKYEMNPHLKFSSKINLNDCIENKCEMKRIKSMKRELINKNILQSKKHNIRIKIYTAM